MATELGISPLDMLLFNDYPVYMSLHTESRDLVKEAYQRGFEMGWKAAEAWR